MAKTIPSTPKPARKPRSPSHLGALGGKQEADPRAGGNRVQIHAQGAIMKATMLVLLSLSVAPFSAAADRCSVPPYGATLSEFHAFAKSFGTVMPVATFFPAICRAKFEGVDRTALYNAGLTDAQIDQESVGELAVKMITFMYKLAHQSDQ